MLTAADTTFSDDIQDQVFVRRNYLLGLWAGRALGHEGAALSAYAQDVIAADDLVPGPFDVVAKVQRDLHDHSVATSRAMILMELHRFEERARAELGS